MLTTRQRWLVETANWIIQTCILSGASLTTAYKVASLFVQGIEKEWQEAEPALHNSQWGNDE